MKRNNRVIDPKTLRKHSRIAEKHEEPIVVAGDRKQTDYGYYIPGHVAKSFETQYMVISASSMTPTWCHAKKVRVVRVVSGLGQYQTFAEDGSQTAQAITAGDEIVVPAETRYRFVAGPTKLEFAVTQDAKYEASLKEIAPVEVVATVSTADLESVSVADKFHRNTVTFGSSDMRRNRAREQIASLRKDRPETRERRGQSEESFFRSSATSSGVNVQPVFDFDPDGAG